MLFAKISEDGSVLKWPLNERQLRELLPQLKLPEVIAQSNLDGTGYVVIHPTPKPLETKDVMVKLKDELIFGDGKYQRQYETVPVPEYLRASRLAKQWKLVRQQRDARMRAFSWRYERHARELRLGFTPTDDLAKLDQYMQSLADITKQDDPFRIQWPEIP